MKDGTQYCSSANCPGVATHSQEGEVGDWLVVIHHCAEHYRELEKGVPMGLLAVDGTRIEIWPKATTEPKPPAVPTLSPH